MPDEVEKIRDHNFFGRDLGEKGLRVKNICRKTDGIFGIADDDLLYRCILGKEIKESIFSP